MSPVERTSGHAARALSVSALAIVVVGLVLWGASIVLSRQSTTEIGIGDDVFHAGRAGRIADEIADVGPVLYSDVSGEGSRDIIVQHLGRDEEDGWHAFLAQPDGRPRDCVWEWRDARRVFRATCDHSLTLPADGQGAEQFPVEVRDGDLEVDLNYATRPPGGGG